MIDQHMIMNYCLTDSSQKHDNMSGGRIQQRLQPASCLRVRFQGASYKNTNFPIWEYRLVAAIEAMSDHQNIFVTGGVGFIGDQQPSTTTA